MTTPTSPDPRPDADAPGDTQDPEDSRDPRGAAAVAERLDEPSGRLGPEPSRTTGATASERASAQTVRDLSEPERLDGSQGQA